MNSWCMASLSSPIDSAYCVFKLRNGNFIVGKYVGDKVMYYSPSEDSMQSVDWSDIKRWKYLGEQ